MNEQTKIKLHELADTCKHPDNYHQGPWMDYIQFAELIIRECASLSLTPMQIDDAQYYHGWLDYRDEILKHFGLWNA